MPISARTRPTDSRRPAASSPLRRAAPLLLLLLTATIAGACARRQPSVAATPATDTGGCPLVPRRADLYAPVYDSALAYAEICGMMQRSAGAWNRGDLDAFVADYLPGMRTTYIGSQGITRGANAIRGAYAPRFAPGGTRDSLSFQALEVDLLAPDVANAIATYVLMRGDSVTAKGPTSLVMRRVSGRWLIVHDHSS